MPAGAEAGAGASVSLGMADDVTRGRGVETRREGVVARVEARGCARAVERTLGRDPAARGAARRAGGRRDAPARGSPT